MRIFMWPKFRILLFFIWLPIAGFSQKGERPNILFILVDDLNHWIGVLGRNHQVKTPNLDKFSSTGTTFLNAYCAAPSCCPSRAALMSGLRPSTSGVYYNRNDWRTVIPKELTLLSHFRANGYKVLGGGKVYQTDLDRDEEFDYYFRSAKSDDDGEVSENGNFGGWGGILKGGDETLGDYEVANWAVGEFQKKYYAPFLLVAGTRKPHWPWNVPKKYYDMYPLEGIQLPPYKINDLDDIPKEGKRMAMAMSRPIVQNAKGDSTGLKWKMAIRGYLACISYADAMIGRMLDAIEKSQYYNNTIIVVLGDNGMHLNEKNHWGKITLWEESTRVPLIIRVPGITTPGTLCHRTVDLMSIYPTLSELCGMDIPKHVEGVSIVDLLKDPNATWNIPAISTQGYNNHAVRTEEWRYIRYNKGGEELYNVKKDKFEWNNLANQMSSAKMKSELGKFLPKNNKKEIEIINMWHKVSYRFFQNNRVLVAIIVGILSCLFLLKAAITKRGSKVVS